MTKTGMFFFSFIAYAALHGIALNYIIKSFFETYSQTVKKPPEKSGGLLVKIKVKGGYGVCICFRAWRYRSRK